mmetsp:Transcript_50272/g.108950  ORF Transcript_50272/g.108950 Transcript_50272/m.108950 type:complete len:222 (-) Transcript_50272:356-1021(-)|eukprot:6213608-Pleurochrysis_carterae.AAC.3
MPITYTLRSALYVALTDRSNAKTLIASRGPGFQMPHASGFASLASEPSSAEAIAAIQGALAAASYTSVCFAGLGEPLLRLPELEDTARWLRLHNPDLPIRVATNGLVSSAMAASVAKRLREVGVCSVSVALASSDASQWQRLACPEYFADREWQGLTGKVAGASVSSAPELGDVCCFVKELVAAGCDVECTTVAAPNVSLEAAFALSHELGASFRTREWFP